MKTILQPDLFVLLLCKHCSGTGITWHERIRHDVQGDLLEVWIGEPLPCEYCATVR